MSSLNKAIRRGERDREVTNLSLHYQSDLVRVLRKERGGGIRRGRGWEQRYYS